MVTTGQGPGYALVRLREQAERFDRLARAAESGSIDEPARRLASDLWERDKVFADVEYRDWSPRPGMPGPVRIRTSHPETSGSGYGSGAPSAEPEWTTSGS
jgi:hypothetical protein